MFHVKPFYKLFTTNRITCFFCFTLPRYYKIHVIRLDMKTKKFWLLIIGILGLITSIYYYQTHQNISLLLAKEQKKIQTNILRKEATLSKSVDSISTVLKDTVSIINFSFSPSQTELDNAFFLYKDNQLFLWSTNQFWIPSSLDTNMLQKDLLSLRNGWFISKYSKFHNYTLVGLALVKFHYEYENAYLENSFAMDVSENSSVQFVTKPGDFPIFNSSKRFLFNLYIDEDNVNNDLFIVLLLTGFLISVFFIVSALYLYLRNYTNKRWMFLVFWAVILLFIFGGRSFSFLCKWPAFVYQSKLFSPIYYASSIWLPSFGDLFFNTLLFGMFVLIIQKLVSDHVQLSKRKPWIKLVISFFLIGIQSFLFLTLVILLKSIVFNSTISFNNDSIFNYSLLHFVAFSIIGVWMFTFVYISYYFLRLSYRLLEFKRVYWILLLLQIAVFTFVNFKYFENYTFIVVYFLIYYVIISLFLYKQISLLKGFSKVVLLLFFSIFINHTIGNYFDIKERNERLLLAEKLGTQHDPITEYRLDELTQLIKNDVIVQEFILKLPKSETRFLDYLEKTYFNSFASKYKISTTLCKENQYLRLQPDNFKIECSLFFNQKVATLGSPTKFDNIWFMNYTPGQISYLYVIDFETPSGSISHLYIELDSKMYVTDVGYPDLLIDKKQKGVNRDFSKYSYARYVNNNLVSQFGKYSYSVNLDNYASSFQNSKFFNYEGYNHLYYTFNNIEKVLLSKKNLTYTEKTVNISFFFIMYGVVILILTLVLSNPWVDVQQKISFRLRMQLYMIIIILISFVLIGTVTIRYFLTLNNKKNIEYVNEKMHSILIEFENQLNTIHQDSLKNISNINQLVFSLSERYFVDINVYSPKGHLVATSRPQMYQQGLILDKMNSEAYYEFRRSKKTIYFHNEYIGKQKYWSIYMPLLTKNGEVGLYINMPYFAKQKELNSEISTFIITFSSVYLFVIFITIIIALLLARYISRPLLLIKEKMSQIQLEDKNEKIEWKSADEIGSLVEVYNKMVDELRYSAELLASSQREQAWREMAQQVAHEIKNPLTPMKLSVQMLERTWNGNDPEWELRLKQFSTTLIEQIDALSDIASSFTNFAKMPQAEYSEEDLLAVVNSTILLYNYPNVDITVESDKKERYDVYIDKNQLIRVFNNLIKNSVQAIKANQKGKVLIRISEYDVQKWLIEVSDNGSGISEGVKDRIFSPNFTTKTSGMGLGLAMVKNIIVDFGGTIWFKSSQEEGTTFSFILPKRKKE